MDMELGKVLAAGAVAVSCYSAFNYNRGSAMAPPSSDVKIVDFHDKGAADQTSRYGPAVSLEHHSTLFEDKLLDPARGDGSNSWELSSPVDLRIVFLAGAAVVLYWTS